VIQEALLNPNHISPDDSFNEGYARGRTVTHGKRKNSREVETSIYVSGGICQILQVSRERLPVI
jgi:hypothetical protein